MAESCPQPLLTLPAADWNAYLKGVYGDANASTLVHLNGHKVVDVLNVSLLRSISARAREYADTIEASFPRHHAWGPCFNNSCDSRHFVPNLNVHCPVELAWRLGSYKYPVSARGFSAVSSHAWVEATHCGGSEREAHSAFFYAARGSGLWINLRRTISFGGHEEAVKFFLGRPSCADKARNEGMWQCDGELDEMARAAAGKGYGSIQFVRHCDAKCEQCLHEVMVLNTRGDRACPPGVEYRRGPRASQRCTCVPHSHSVGTRHKPFRGQCASCAASPLHGRARH